MIRRSIAAIVSCFFVFGLVSAEIIPSRNAYAAEIAFPQPNALMGQSAEKDLPSLRGILVKQNGKGLPTLEFAIDCADQGSVSKAEVERLAGYFLAAVSVNEKDVWVNLSVYEKDRVTDPALAQTDLGTDLLSQDYLLKQLSASLTYPDSDSGKAYWAAQRAAAGENQPQLFDKVWIVPARAEVTEYRDAAFITDAALDLKVKGDALASMDEGAAAGSATSVKVLEDVILPTLREEVNHGERFARLRQMYSALILASWAKRRFASLGLQESRNVQGFRTDHPQTISAVSKLYARSFEKGVYDVTRRDNGDVRQYISGGADINGLGEMVEGHRKAGSSIREISRAVRGPLVRAAVGLDSVASDLSRGMYKVVFAGMMLAGLAMAETSAHKTESLLLAGDIEGAKKTALTDTAKARFIGEYEGFLKEADGYVKDVNAANRRLYENIPEKANFVREREQLNVKTVIDRVMQTQFWNQAQLRLSTMRKGMLDTAVSKKDSATIKQVNAIDSLELQRQIYVKQVSALDAQSSGSGSSGDTVSMAKTLRAYDSISIVIDSVSAIKVDSGLTVATVSAKATALAKQKDSLMTVLNTQIAALAPYASDTGSYLYRHYHEEVVKTSNQIAVVDTAAAKVAASIAKFKTTITLLSSLTAEQDRLARVLWPSRYPTVSSDDARTTLLKKIADIDTKLREMYLWLFNGKSGSGDIAKRYKAEMDRLASDVAGIKKDLNIADGLKNMLAELDNVSNGLIAVEKKRQALAAKAALLSAAAARRGIDLSADEIMAAAMARGRGYTPSASTKDGYTTASLTGTNVLFGEIGGQWVSMDISGRYQAPDKALYDRNASYLAALRMPLGSQLSILGDVGLIHPFGTDEYMKSWVSPGTSLTQKQDVRGLSLQTQGAAVGSVGIVDASYLVHWQTMLSREYLTGGKEWHDIEWQSDDVLAQEAVAKAQFHPLLGLDARWISVSGTAAALLHDTLVNGGDSTATYKEELTRIPLTVNAKNAAKDEWIKGSFTFMPENLTTETQGQSTSVWAYKLSPKVTLLFGNYVSLGAEYERSTTGGGDMLGEKFVFPWKFSVAGFELSLKEQIELKSQVAGAKAEHSKVFEDASLKIALPFADFPYVIATYNREAIAGMYTGAEKYEDWTKQKFSLTGQLPGLSGSTFMGGLQLDNKGRGSNGNFLIAPAVIGQIVVPVGVPKPHVVRAEERTAASHVSEPVVRKDSVVTPVAVPVVVKKDSVVTPVIAPVVVKKDSTAAPAAVVRKDSAQYFVERGGILVPMTREDQAKIDSLVEKGRHAVIPFSSDSLPGLQNHLVISVIDLAKDFQKYAKLYHLAFAYHDGLYALSVPAAAGMPNSFLDPLSGETRTAVRFPHWVYVEQKAAFDGTLPLPWAGNAPTVAVRMAFDQKNYTLMTYYCAKDLAALVKAGYRFSPTLRDNEYLLLAPDGTRSVIRISPEAAKSIVSSSGTERDLGGIDMNLSGVLSSSTVSAPSAGLWGSAIRGLSVKSVRLYAVSSLDRFFV